jgi:flagellar biosynthesis/type III secretory pathway protein FliH
MGLPSSIHTRIAPSAVRISSERFEELEAGAVRQRLEAAYAQGRADEAAAGLCEAAEKLDAASGRAEAARERAEEEIGRDAVLLAVEIANQLLKVHIEAGDYDLERIVRSALDDSDVGRIPCTVHLHPADHERLAEVVFRSGTKLEADPEMQPGEVHVSTPRGLLVRDLDAALDAIREQLLEDLA